MKRKILLVLLLICPFFINACSCDKFNIQTYASAVRNYNKSIGMDYKLTVTTYTEGSNIHVLEESYNKFEFNTAREVLNFASEMNKYEILTDDYGINSAPQKVYELNRYYVGDSGKFYTNEVAHNNDFKQIDNVTYEQKYDVNSVYHINNLVPVFKTEDVANFSIIKDKSHKGYSIATFSAACPSTVSCDEDKEVITYKVTIDKEFYFSKIEFTTVFENKTIEYKYEFNEFNSDVEIIFPNDLVNY